MTLHQGEIDVKTALEFVEKYADDLFEFSFYYKYSFTYQHAEDSEVSVTVGGNYNDIYRADMTNQMPLCKILNEAGGEFSSATIGDAYMSLDNDAALSLAYARLKARTMQEPQP